MLIGWRIGLSAPLEWFNSDWTDAVFAPIASMALSLLCAVRFDLKLFENLSLLIKNCVSCCCSLCRIVSR